MVLGDITILPKDSTKLLGIFLDRKLTWSLQANTARAKGMKYMMAAKRLSKGKRGVPGRLGMQLYTGVVVQKMMYAAEIWCKLIIEPKDRIGRLREATRADPENHRDLCNWGNGVNTHCLAGCAY